MNTTIKFLGLSLALFVLLSIASFHAPEQKILPKINPKDSIADSLDVTKKFISINDDKNGKISDQFRAGSVVINNLNPIVKETENGYEIQLSATNIPSPVIYNGKVYVSGGFGSKQYYSFEAKTGKKVWSVDIDDDGPSSAAIADDIIVYNTESCTIFACKTGTGEQLWSYWLGDPLMSMPTIANGIVFTAYPSMYSANIDNQMDGLQINKSPVIEQLSNQSSNIKNNNHSTLVSHVVIAIELKTGKILWQKRVDGDVMSAPVAVNNELYVTTFSGTLFKFKQKTGEILSAKSIRATSAPVIYKDQIFVSQRSDKHGEEVQESVANYASEDMIQTNEYNKRSAPYLDKNIQEKSKLKELAMDYDAGNGFSAGAPVSSGYLKANDVVGQSNVSSLQSFQGSRTLHHNGKNYNTMGDELICSDPVSGKESWKIKIKGDLHAEGGFIGTPPILAGDKIVIASYNGEITINDPKTGNLIKTYNIKDNIRYQPIVQDGWIYVTTTSGKLVAINTQDKTLTGWPMWGANSARTNLVK